MALLPTNLTAGNSGHVSHSNQAYDKLNGAWYDVQADYGAVGNGTTDDTAAIQAAIDAAFTAGGGVVYFPVASYKLTAALQVKNYVRLIGAGDQATTLIQATSNAHGIYGNNAVRVAIENLWIEGPNTGTGKGIFLEWDDAALGGTPYHLLRAVTVNEFAVGIEMENPFVLSMERVIVQNCTTGFYLHGQVPTGSAGTSTTLTGCYAISCTTGIKFETMTYCSLISCAVDHCTTGYEIKNCNGFVLTGCGSEYSSGDTGLTNPTGVKVDGGSSVVLTGFYQYNNLFRAIYVTGSAQNVQIIGAREINDIGTPTNFIQTDTGTTITPLGLHHGTANTFASGTNLYPITDSTLQLKKAGSSTVSVDNFGGVMCVDKTLALVSQGTQVRIAEGGSAGCMGTSTLVAGTVTVSTTSVNANSRIFLTCRTPGGTAGFLRVSAVVDGTSFTITSSSGSDTSVVSWVLFQAA